MTARKANYNIDFQTGWVGDAGNLLMSLPLRPHRSDVQSKRDFSALPYSASTRRSLQPERAEPGPLPLLDELPHGDVAPELQPAR